MSSVSPEALDGSLRMPTVSTSRPVPRPGPDSADGLDGENVLHPFLSGRGNLRAVTRRCGLEDHRVDVVLGQAGLAERVGEGVTGYS